MDKIQEQLIGRLLGYSWCCLIKNYVKIFKLIEYKVNFRDSVWK